MNLSESISIAESITAGPNVPDPVGTRIFVQDRFATQNVFNGGQIGSYVEQRWNRWFVNVRASVALGVNQETIDIGGNQARTRPGQAPEYFTGGLLAAQSNIGRFSYSRFSVAPDVALNFGYQFTPYLRGFIGYSFLYWSNVVRPGQQIDRNVDLTFIPNSPPGIPPSGQPARHSRPTERLLGTGPELWRPVLVVRSVRLKRRMDMRPGCVGNLLKQGMWVSR